MSDMSFNQRAHDEVSRKDFPQVPCMHQSRGVMMVAAATAAASKAGTKRAQPQSRFGSRWGIDEEDVEFLMVELSANATLEAQQLWGRVEIGSDLLRKDWRFLDSGIWLNDQILAAFLKCVVKSPEYILNKILVLSPFVVDIFRNHHKDVPHMESVWLKHMKGNFGAKLTNFSSIDSVVMSIHVTENHWVCAELTFVTEEPGMEDRWQGQVYNSKVDICSDEAAKLMLDIVMNSLKHMMWKESKKDESISVEKINAAYYFLGEVPSFPEQGDGNFCDCGPFTAKAIESFAIDGVVNCNDLEPNAYREHMRIEIIKDGQLSLLPSILRGTQEQSTSTTAPRAQTSSGKTAPTSSTITDIADSEEQDLQKESKIVGEVKRVKGPKRKRDAATVSLMNDGDRLVPVEHKANRVIFGGDHYPFSATLKQEDGTLQEKTARTWIQLMISFAARQNAKLRAQKNIITPDSDTLNNRLFVENDFMTWEKTTRVKFMQRVNLYTVWWLKHCESFGDSPGAPLWILSVANAGIFIRKCGERKKKNSNEMPDPSTDTAVTKTALNKLLPMQALLDIEGYTEVKEANRWDIKKNSTATVIKKLKRVKKDEKSQLDCDYSAGSWGENSLGNGEAKVTLMLKNVVTVVCASFDCSTVLKHLAVFSMYNEAYQTVARGQLPRNQELGGSGLYGPYREVGDIIQIRVENTKDTDRHDYFLIRARDATRCPIAARNLFFYFKHHIFKQPLPNYSTTDHGWKTRSFYNIDAATHIKLVTHHQETAGICLKTKSGNSRTRTHAARKDVVANAEANDYDMIGIQNLGWRGSARTDCHLQTSYMQAPEIKQLLRNAGFCDAAPYSLARSQVLPQEEGFGDLIAGDSFFHHIQEVVARITDTFDEDTYGDIQAHMRLLSKIAECMMQDMPFMFEAYPELRIRLRNTIFDTQRFAQWEAHLKGRVLAIERELANERSVVLAATQKELEPIVGVLTTSITASEQKLSHLISALPQQIQAAQHQQIQGGSMIALQLSDLQHGLCNMEHRFDDLRQEVKEDRKDSDSNVISLLLQMQGQMQVLANEVREMKGAGLSSGQQGAAENISISLNSNKLSMHSSSISADSGSTCTSKKRKAPKVGNAQKIVLQNLDFISPEELWRLWNVKEEGGEGFYEKKKTDFKSFHHYDQYRVVAQLIAAVRFNTIHEDKTKVQGLLAGLEVARELMPNTTPSCKLGIEACVIAIRERLVKEEELVGRNMGLTDRRSAPPFTRKPREDKSETKGNRKKCKTQIVGESHIIHESASI